MDIACPTIDEISPASDGNINVLFVRANLSNARTYCSATVNVAAFFPSSLAKLLAIIFRPEARASATATMAAASPTA